MVFKILLLFFNGKIAVSLSLSLFYPVYMNAIWFFKHYPVSRRGPGIGGFFVFIVVIRFFFFIFKHRPENIIITSVSKCKILRTRIHIYRHNNTCTYFRWREKNKKINKKSQRVLNGKTKKIG